jgi:hypothetical protein
MARARAITHTVAINPSFRLCVCERVLPTHSIQLAHSPIKGSFHSASFEICRSVEISIRPETPQSPAPNRLGMLQIMAKSNHGRKTCPFAYIRGFSAEARAGMGMANSLSCLIPPRIAAFVSCKPIIIEITFFPRPRRTKMNFYSIIYAEGRDAEGKAGTGDRRHLARLRRIECFTLQVRAGRRCEE